MTTYRTVECLFAIARAAKDHATILGMTRPWDLDKQRAYWRAQDTARDLYNAAGKAYQAHVNGWKTGQ